MAECLREPTPISQSCLPELPEIEKKFSGLLNFLLCQSIKTHYLNISYVHKKAC